MAGKGLLGEEGLLKPLIAKFVESALDSELSSHIEGETLKMGKKRINGMENEVSK